ncbi:MAG: hypothetical protein P8011_08775 [Acidihalobacter sp.]|uniref:hypothetical protein n=1 Tax=Acidihalobacter sp. TaxID=1872108 RepID=UPI00307D5D70
MITDTAHLWTQLRQLTYRVRNIADDITVVFVANRQHGLSDASSDRSTEYLTDYETNQILTGLRESGFRTLYFEGENEFISFVLAQDGKISNSKWNIVYNTAQSGTDPGRKSMVPAFCALHQIPTCNSDSYAVSLARHKLHVHAILRRFNIPTPDTWAFGAETGWLRGEQPPNDLLLIAKAGHESASIGLDEASIGIMSLDFESVLRQKSIDLQQQIVVQKFISGREFELPVINMMNTHRPLDPISITFNGDAELGERVLLYDLVAKDRFGFTACSSENESEANRMRDAAANVCEVLGLKGFARVDFRMDDNLNVWVTDVSTSPHIVMHSSFWHLFEGIGWSHSEMLACMIAVNAVDLGWLR